MRIRSRAAASMSALLPGLALSLGLTAGPQLARAATHAADPAPADAVAGVWQSHSVFFSYAGFTTLFTCDGMESHVRQILLHLGARKDAQVTASGCPGPNAPSHTVFVHADFHSLAPAAGAAASDAIDARWSPLELAPQRPSFMDEGDCELVQEMKDLITKNFSLREVDYRTDCFPNDVTLDSFAVKAQALRAARNAPAASSY